MDDEQLANSELAVERDLVLCVIAGRLDLDKEIEKKENDKAECLSRRSDNMDACKRAGYTWATRPNLAGSGFIDVRGEPDKVKAWERDYFECAGWSPSTQRNEACRRAGMSRP
jgi:hypothetical protein